MDLKGQGFIDLREFVHGFFKIYYSNLDTKLKMVFDMYDFDKDEFITKEDVRVVLSHVPISNQVEGFQRAEGQFTAEGGGNQVFLDRLQTQEQIMTMIETVFGSRKRLNFNEFKDIITNVSSEMFLTIMLLLQSNIPCSENFNRYKRNYEKYLQQNPDTAGKTKTAAEVREIASPRLCSKFKQFNQMNLAADVGDFNLNPDAQKILLKFAVNQPQG